MNLGRMPIFFILFASIDAFELITTFSVVWFEKKTIWSKRSSILIK